MPDTDDADALMTTGDLAAITGLSLRSIRYYEEVDLVPVVERSKGGHRLYDQAALDKLLLIMKMKPLDFSLDEMGSLLSTLDVFRSPSTSATERAAARETLAMFADLVDQRWQWLQERMTIAEQFRTQLREELDVSPRGANASARSTKPRSASGSRLKATARRTATPRQS